MATIELNPLIKGISGKIGRSIVAKQRGRTTLFTKRSSKPKKRSEQQERSSLKFRDASAFAKNAIKDPTIKAYYKRKASLMEKNNNAYTTCIKDFMETPSLTFDQVLVEAKNSLREMKTVTRDERVLEVAVTSASGDIVAQGIAVQTSAGHWHYIAPITNLQVIVREKLRK
jgi:hypothetical protein